MADADAVDRAIGVGVAQQGPIGLLVAGAGMVVPGFFRAQPADAFRRSIEVNYLGAVHLVHAALPHMPPGGRVVLIASGAALIGFYGYTSYAPSKFAVRGLAEALRSELRPQGIGVSLVHPPDTDTPGYREELRRRPAITSRLAASGGLMTADAVAAAILRGIARRQFTIAPGLALGLLAPLHSLVGPLLHRLWFDPLIAQEVQLSRPADAPAAARRAREE